MSATVFEIDFADSRWWFRSPTRESSFASKIEAIEAALLSAHSQSEVCLRIHHQTGPVEGEVTLSAIKPAPDDPTAPRAKSRKEADRDTARSIRYYSSRPIHFVNKRIEELTEEIPLEALVYRGGAILSIVSLTLLLLRHKYKAAWALAVATAALQLQYSYQGRTGLTDILRKRGYRSRKEIEAEKYSLEAIRGDFAAFSELSDPIERARKCLDMFL
jgi:hypothetical protein